MVAIVVAVVAAVVKGLYPQQSYINLDTKSKNLNKLKRAPSSEHGASRKEAWQASNKRDSGGVGKR